MVEWSPGDSSLLALIASTAYLLSGIAALLLARASDVPPDAGSKRLLRSRSRRRVWTTAGVIFLVLAVERQLGLLEFLADSVRAAAVGDGWYGERRDVQFPLVIGLSIIGAATLAIGVYTSRRAGPWSQAGIAGAILMGFIVAMKALSFHNLDAVLRTIWLHMKLVHLIELVCLTLAWVGIAGFAARLRDERHGARLRQAAMKSRLRRLQQERQAREAAGG